uniref:Uncharacterized protein n=1 Tax=Arundo donax TaxID=35708 RepID=A0A0A9H1K5_ARUDO
MFVLLLKLYLPCKLLIELQHTCSTLFDHLKIRYPFPVYWSE